MCFINVAIHTCDFHFHQVVFLNGETDFTQVDDFRGEGGEVAIPSQGSYRIAIDKHIQLSGCQVVAAEVGQHNLGLFHAAASNAFYIAEGGPYEDANHNYTEVIEITGDGCYDLTIYDAGGNGFSGSGVYGLKAGSATLFTGKAFGDHESNEFSYEVVASADEASITTTSIYPNPTSGMVSIVCDGEQMVTIYNMAGQRVFDGMSNGYLQIDLKAYGAGIYAIQVGNETQRVVVK